MQRRRPERDDHSKSLNPARFNLANNKGEALTRYQHENIPREIQQVTFQDDIITLSS